MSVRFRWRTYLRAAATEQEVVELVRTYLAAWSAEERSHLPPGTWPESMMSRDDLVRATLKVGQVHSAFSGSRASLTLVQELLLFLTQAAVRATQLAPLPGEGAIEQRPVGGKVLTEEEKKLFEAPPVPRNAVESARDPEKEG